MQLIGQDEGAMWGIIFIQPCNFFKQSSFFRAHIWRFLFLYGVKIFELLLSKTAVKLDQCAWVLPYSWGGGGVNLPELFFLERKWAIIVKINIHNNCHVGNWFLTKNIHIYHDVITFFCWYQQKLAFHKEFQSSYGNNCSSASFCPILMVDPSNGCSWVVVSN